MRASSWRTARQHSLDVQYYLIQNDRTGRLLLRNLRDAARRGVRVRLLVDDLYTTGGDALFVGLAAFPNVEVRLFNPFCCGRQSLARQVHRVARRLRPPQPPDAQQAVHRRRRDGRRRRPQHRRRVLHAQRCRTTSSTWTRSSSAPSSRSSPRSSTPTGTARTSTRCSRSSASDLDRDELRTSFDRLVDDGDQMMSVTLPPVDILGLRPDPRGPRCRPPRSHLG